MAASASNFFYNIIRWQLETRGISGTSTRRLLTNNTTKGNPNQTDPDILTVATLLSKKV